MLLVGDDGRCTSAPPRPGARERVRAALPAPRDRRRSTSRCSSAASIALSRTILSDADVPPGLRSHRRAIGVGNYSHGGRADAVGGRRHRHALRRSRQPREPVQRQGDRPAEDLRRPGGDRDPERAPVQRDARSASQGRAAHRRAERSARLPDRDQRRAARHQPVADRRHAGVRGDPRERVASLRQPVVGGLSLRRAARSPRGDAATGRTRRSPTRAASIRRRRTRRC